MEQFSLELLISMARAWPSVVHQYDQGKVVALAEVLEEHMQPGEILLSIMKRDLTVSLVYGSFILPDQDYYRALAQVANGFDDAGLDRAVEGNEKPLSKQLREQLRHKLN